MGRFMSKDRVMGLILHIAVGFGRKFLVLGRHRNLKSVEKEERFSIDIRGFGLGFLACC